MGRGQRNPWLAAVGFLFARQKKAHVVETWASLMVYCCIAVAFLLACHNETVSAVLRPAAFILRFADGDFFTVANRRHSVSGDPEGR